MRDDLTQLLDRIDGLLDVRSSDGTEPLLTEIEHTLTDGYARALALEAERRRIEKRIAAIARDVDGPAQAGELRDLAERLTGAEDEHARLRRLLEGLRRRADQLRVAALEQQPG